MRHWPSADSNKPRSILRHPSGIGMVLCGERMKFAAIAQSVVTQDVSRASECAALGVLVRAQSGLV